MRNGNSISAAFPSKYFLVLILPMRNGNPLIISIPSRSKLGSYPTYEEWKLINNYDGFGGEGFVLILPMRNGNIQQVDVDISY